MINDWHSYYFYYFERRPHLAFMVVQSVVCAAVGVMALRMKYLVSGAEGHCLYSIDHHTLVFQWFPQIVVLAAVGLCSLLHWVFERAFRANVKFVGRSAVLLLLCAAMIARHKTVYDAQMKNEQVKSHRRCVPCLRFAKSIF